MNKTVNVNNIFTTFSFTNSNFLILLFSGEWWGANENCTLIDTVKNITVDVNGTDVETTVSVFATDLPRCYPQEGITEDCTFLESPATQFWERYVLSITEVKYLFLRLYFCKFLFRSSHIFVF